MPELHETIYRGEYVLIKRHNFIDGVAYTLFNGIDYYEISEDEAKDLVNAD